MEAYIQNLKAHVAKHPPIFEENGIDSILDTLYWNYAETNRLENNLIREKLHALYGCLEHLCLRDKDKVIDIVCALCSEHERISFAAGVQVGVQLTQELTIQ